VSQPILVGYDPEHSDKAPVEFGLAAARFTGAMLIIGSVFADSAMIGQMGHGHMSEDLGSDANRSLDHLKQSLRTGGVKTEFWPLGGRSAPSALHQAAEEFSAGMLVVGSAHEEKGGIINPGSVADRLMHGAPCPIAVIPAGWTAGGGLNVLGVAYVDSEEGREALQAAATLARRAGAKLRVLTAIKPKQYGKEAGDLPGHESSTYDEVGTSENAVAEGVRPLVKGDDLEIEFDVSAQDPGDFLVAASENVDLLICGSRGYGPRKAVLLGGVSRRIAQDARCPVIILARGTEGQLQDLVEEPERAEV
jgi:nucleotide-binding universal stress UspA family protein